MQRLLDTSDSVVSILKKLGFDGYNGNHRTLTQRIKEDGFDLKLFEENRQRQKSNGVLSARLAYQMDNDKVFVVNSPYTSNSGVKLRMVKMGIKYECSECQIGLLYNNKSISLQLDHINGINNDNRLDNLRFLCPNCHSQTSTFSGKNRNKEDEISNPIHDIILKRKKIKKIGKRNSKILWPSSDELSKTLWEIPTTQLSKELGVSDVAISKHIKKLGLTKPPRGYWTKRCAPIGI